MKQDNIISVDIDDVKDLVLRGSDIVMTAEAEEALFKLLKLESIIKSALDTAKKNIEERALAYNPNFKSVEGDNVKVGYQFFGAKYAIDDKQLDNIPGNLYETSTKYSPDSKAIDQIAAEKQALPLGIIERERTKTITIKLAEKFEDMDFS